MITSPPALKKTPDTMMPINANNIPIYNMPINANNIYNEKN
jgi:hypothetical protein